MLSDLEKLVKAMPDTQLSDAWIAANLSVPLNVRIGDNPLFDAYNSDRK